jgi:prepilin-type N-terminal cleavage/methylation domain-containing protein
MKRRGWTLIELMAVLALLSVLMAGAVVVVRAPLTQGRLQMSIESVLLADQTTRSQVLRSGQPAELHFNVGSPTTLTIERPQSRESAVQEIAALREVRPSGQVREADQVRIPIAGDGSSRTYGLRFETKAGTETWVVMAGGTGQPIRDLTRQEADALLQAY